MGRFSNKRALVLIVCFTLTALFLQYYYSPSDSKTKKMPLSKALSDIKGWRCNGLLPLDNNIVEELHLDDYLNQNYSGVSGRVSLYIGYYKTSKKVGAAHDPTVCFPGQGWLLSNKQKGKLILSTNKDPISFSKMTAERNQQKELVVYWFQSYDKTNSGTFSQKIALLRNKLFKGGEENAFVRITTPIGERPQSECEETIFEFIRAFYPVFLSYISDDSSIMD